jgi:hypothetical protein
MVMIRVGPCQSSLKMRRQSHGPPGISQILEQDRPYFLVDLAAAFGAGAALASVLAAGFAPLVDFFSSAFFFLAVSRASPIGGLSFMRDVRCPDGNDAVVISN